MRRAPNPEKHCCRKHNTAKTKNSLHISPSYRTYYENEFGRRSSAKLLTRDEEFLIAVNIAKLPSVPRQILKDIPRPPNTASRDD